MPSSTSPGQPMRTSDGLIAPGSRPAPADHVRVAAGLLPAPPRPADQPAVLLGRVGGDVAAVDRRGRRTSPTRPSSTARRAAAATRGARAWPCSGGDERRQRPGVDVRREHQVRGVGEARERHGGDAEQRPLALRLPEPDAARRADRGLAGADGVEGPVVEGAEQQQLGGADRRRPGLGSLSRSQPATLGSAGERRRRGGPRCRRGGPGCPAAVEVEAGPRLGDGRRQLAHPGAGARRQPVGEGRPRRRAVPTDRRLEPGEAGLRRRRADRRAPGVLVHVDDDVEVVARPPSAIASADLGDVRLVEGAGRRLEPATSSRAAARRRSRARRCRAKSSSVSGSVGGCAGWFCVVLGELVDVDAAQQHRPPVVVDEAGAGPGLHAERRERRPWRRQRTGRPGDDRGQGQQQRRRPGGDHRAAIKWWRRARPSRRPCRGSCGATS